MTMCFFSAIIKSTKRSTETNIRNVLPRLIKKHIPDIVSEMTLKIKNTTEHIMLGKGKVL